MSAGLTVRSAVESVPLLDLKRQDEKLRDEFLTALAAVCASGQFVLGPEVKRLEESVAEYNGVKFGVGCASGSDALLLALMAAGVGPGDEVIVPSFTFFATASCVPRLGATPVFADIDPATFNLDPADVERKITSRTKAIIPVHLYGQMADMRSFRAMTCEHEDPRRRGIVLIEDAAQAIGAAIDGIPVGSWGDMACLSFYPTKNLGGQGDAGMVLTNSSRRAGQIRLLRGHGMEPRYYHQLIGVNSRIDSYQAAILNVKLPHLDDWTAQRTENALRYAELFDAAGLSEMVTLPTALPDRRHVWNQYVVRIPGGMRDSLRSELSEKKIGSEIYYPLGLHQQDCFRYLDYAPTDLPETFLASGEVLALPMFPGLRPEEQLAVVEGIRDFFAAGRSRTTFPAVERREQIRRGAA